MQTAITGAVRLQDDTKTTLETRILSLAAYSLAAASFSIAAFAGWTRGNNFSGSLSWSAVGCAAVAISIFAPAAIRDAARRQQLTAAASMTGAYALALLMTISVALGSGAGGRVHLADTAAAASDARARAKSSYEATTTELATLAPTRSSGELDAMLAPLSAKIGKANCLDWVKDASVRAACVQRNALEVERARAFRKADLMSTQAVAATALQTAPTVPANADAAAIAGYLEAVGVQVSADTVSKLLVLLAVALLDVAPGLVLGALSGRQDSKLNNDGGVRAEAAPQPRNRQCLLAESRFMIRLSRVCRQARCMAVNVIWRLCSACRLRRLGAGWNPSRTCG